MASRLLSCVVALSVALMSSAAMAAKDSGKTKKEPAPVKKSSSSDIVYTPGVFYGTKSLETIWDPVKSQAEMGVSLVIENPDWAYTFVAEYSSSKASGKTTPDDPGFEYSGSTSEIGVGLRHFFEGQSEQMKFFIEGGAVQISAKYGAKETATNLSGSESDSAIGYWVGGGLDYLVTDTLSVGVEARMSAAEVTLFGIKGEAGGTHLGVTLRYHPE